MRKGRFSQPAAEIAQRYSESVSFDWRLYACDIAGSIVHAAALARAGIITEAECREIERGLRAVQKQIESGKFEWDASLEDVHMNIEAALTKRIGAASAKLHTARSRNDQIALDLRLYVKAEIAEVSGRLRSLQTALLDVAQRHIDVVMPGYTHLQRAQPITFSHYLLGQMEAFERDANRLRDCLARTDVLPLGSGALAGSTIVLDRERIARDLGFSSVSQNSVDAVGDRDFVCEFLFCLAMIGLHLSRLSEDLIIWSTTEFGFLEFSDSFSTHSSLMPQKKNPDMAELTRGQDGPPLRKFDVDLNHDESASFFLQSRHPGRQESAVRFRRYNQKRVGRFCCMLPELKINRERMNSSTRDPNLFATDLAEYLVKKRVPFREAHQIVGELVVRSFAKSIPLDQIGIAEMKKFSPHFEEDVAKIFDVRGSLAQRRAIGAPSPENIAARIKRWKAKL